MSECEHGSSDSSLASVAASIEVRDGVEGLSVDAVDLETGAQVFFWIPNTMNGLMAAASIIDNAPSLIEQALTTIQEEEDESL